jgi:lysophospholipase L1-like esterase
MLGWAGAARGALIDAVRPRPSARSVVSLAVSGLALGAVLAPARAWHGPAPAPVPAPSGLRVLHFGDSHAGASALHTLMRADLGLDGPGWIFPWAAGAPGDVRAGRSSGWQRLGLKPGARDDASAAGLTGLALETRRAGATAWVEAAFSRARVYLLQQPGGGAARLRVDGRVVARVGLDAPEPDARVLTWDAPGAAISRRIEIVSEGGGAVRVLGLALEGPSGQTYSPLWINGAQASWLLRQPEAVVASLVRGEAPALLILAFGTNEACDDSFDAALYEAGLQRVVARLRSAAPRAALLLVAPPDAGASKADPRALDAVIEVQRRLAQAWGAGFVDLRAVMGGAGTIARWQQAGLARPDEIHFTPEGYRELGRHVLAAAQAQLGREAAAPAARLAAAPPRPAPAARSSQGIFLFRTRDGRFIMTDDPSRVAGESGEWVGAQPE